MTGYRHLLLIVALLIALPILAVELVLLLQMPNNPALGIDFIDKWASARLFLQNRDPWSLRNLIAVEEEQGFPPSWAGVSRSPPTLHVLLIPFALLPFPIASTVWLMVNVFVLALCAYLGWSYFLSHRGLPALGISMILVFSFSRALHSLYVGQVNTVVLVGILGFLNLERTGRRFRAGASLTLTLVKPHLVYLVLPLSIFESLRLGRWSVMAGFTTATIILLVVATVLYPGWIGEYLNLISVEAQQGSHPAQKATLAGTVAAYVDAPLARYLSALVLALFLFLYWRLRKRVDLASWLSLALIVGLPTAPFGWSTDQVLLLLPVLQIVAWTLGLTPTEKGVVISSLILIYGYALWFWVVSYQEVAFLALPLAIGLLWGYAYRKAIKPASSLPRGRS